MGNNGHHVFLYKKKNGIFNKIIKKVYFFYGKMYFKKTAQQVSVLSMVNIVLRVAFKLTYIFDIVELISSMIFKYFSVLDKNNNT